MTMTPEELKKFLAPETFECEVCKKTHQTHYGAKLCAHNDRLAQQEAARKLAEQKVKEKKGAENLKKVLEQNLI